MLSWEVASTEVDRRHGVVDAIDQRAEWAFFTNGDDESVQRLWAREHGLNSRISLAGMVPSVAKLAGSSQR